MGASSSNSSRDAPHAGADTMVDPKKLLRLRLFRGNSVQDRHYHSCEGNTAQICHKQISGDRETMSSQEGLVRRLLSQSC